MGTAIKHPVPDRVKPSFIIFDIRTLWRSGLLNDGLTRYAWHGMLYSCSLPELDMGPFCWIQSNPIHKLTDPIQSDPRCMPVFRPTSNPIHRTPGGENNFTCRPYTEICSAFWTDACSAWITTTVIKAVAVSYATVNVEWKSENLDTLTVWPSYDYEDNIIISTIGLRDPIQSNPWMNPILVQLWYDTIRYDRRV